MSAAVLGVSSSFTGTDLVSAAFWRPPLTAHRPDAARDPNARLLYRLPADTTFALAADDRRRLARD
ncbi:hypothetical protein [Mycobacterium sp.]|uniref:hypothetical protein n=1 Tax=Mycobacterium sp. TaxID=1785 RepID=UPI0031E3CAC6